MNFFDSLFFINLHYFIQIVVFLVMLFVVLCFFIYIIIKTIFFKSNKEKVKKNRFDFNNKRFL